jgi:hypothetical protein
MPFIASRVFGWMPAQVTDAWNLLDVPSGNAYSICNSIFCNYCAVTFLDIRFDDDEMDRLYDDYRGGQYAFEREQFEQGYQVRNHLLNDGTDYVNVVEDIIRPYVTQHPRVLDWGGDSGKNTPFLKTSLSTHIYDISGVATTPPSISISDEQSLTNAYDLIVISNVLEHVPYPKEMLGEVTLRANSDTVIYVEVPLEQFVSEELNKKDTFYKKRHWHEHVNFFSAKSIEEMAKSLNLEIIHTTIIPVEVAGKRGANQAVLLKRNGNLQKSEFGTL